MMRYQVPARSRFYLLLALVSGGLAVGVSIAGEPLLVGESAPFKQDPEKIDRGQEAELRAEQILIREMLVPKKPEYKYVHDFYAPADIKDFAKKNERVFIVAVGGYPSKSGHPTFRFIWIHENGDHIWECEGGANCD